MQEVVAAVQALEINQVVQAQMVAQAAPEVAHLVLRSQLQETALLAQMICRGG